MYDQFQPQPNYQREPSPSESSKFTGAQRTQSQAYRDPKFNQDSGSGAQQPQTTSPQPNQAQPSPTSSPAQQHYAFGNPMYGYPPFIAPNQYSYQTAQSQYAAYRHPYLRGFPGYSANSTAFPPAPSATGSSMGTGYPEELVMSQEGYKNMFPPQVPMGTYYPTTDMTNLMLNKPTTQQQPQTGASKNQSFSQQGTTGTSDISNASFKAQQQQQQQVRPPFLR
jgi:hypothetical protein